MLEEGRVLGVGVCNLVANFFKFGVQKGVKKMDMLLVLFANTVGGRLDVNVTRNDWSGGGVAGVDSEIVGSALG